MIAPITRSTDFRPPVAFSRTTEFRGPLSVSREAETIARAADTSKFLPPTPSTLPSKYTVGGVKKFPVKATLITSQFTHGGASKISKSIIAPGGAFSQFAAPKLGQLEAMIRLDRGY